jgi:hypothetical protein
VCRFQATCKRPAENFLVGVTLRSSSATSFLDRPVLAVVSAQVVVALEHVGDAHVGAVVVDFPSGAQRDEAEEHDLGETGGVLERRGGFQLSLVASTQFISWAWAAM